MKLSRTDRVGIFPRTERRQECRLAATAMGAQNGPQWGRKEVHRIPIRHTPELIWFPFKPEQESAYHFSWSGCFPRQEIYCFKLMPWDTQLYMLFVLDTRAWINRSDSKELSALPSQVWVKRTLQMLSDVIAKHTYPDIRLLSAVPGNCICQEWPQWEQLRMFLFGSSCSIFNRV